MYPPPPPPCYRFKPKHHELITHFLVRIATNQPLPSDDVTFCDIYDDSDSWYERFQETGQKTLYVFTKLRKTSKDDNGARFGRATKSGTWKETQKNIPVFAAQMLVGHRKAYKFIPKQGSGHIKGRWLMDEYTLNPKLMESDGYVVCKIKRKKELKKAKKAADHVDMENLQPQKLEAQVNNDNNTQYLTMGDDDMDKWLSNVDVGEVQQMASTWLTLEHADDAQVGNDYNFVSPKQNSSSNTPSLEGQRNDDNDMSIVLSAVDEDPTSFGMQFTMDEIDKWLTDL